MDHKAFGSGNVFEDLAVPNPDEHLKKSRVVAAIAIAVRERGLTHSAAAAAMGVSDSDLARILRGQFRDQTLERLSEALAAVTAPADASPREGVRAFSFVDYQLQRDPGESDAEYDARRSLFRRG